MAIALKKAGIKTLTVPESQVIELPPYKNGFIGGCATVFNKDVYFFGDYSMLPYYKELKEFIFEAGYEALSLKSNSLIDLGGMILIKCADCTV